jgi:hypothetical protein
MNGMRLEHFVLCCCLNRLVCVSLPCHSLAVSQCICMSVRAWQSIVTATMWDLVIPPGYFGVTGGFNNQMLVMKTLSRLPPMGKWLECWKWQDHSKCPRDVTHNLRIIGTFTNVQQIAQRWNGTAR